MTEIRSSRASLALALQDYKGPRPGISLVIAALALLVAVVVGVTHIVMLGQSGGAIEDGRRTIRALHSYNAALEVWRKMAMVLLTARQDSALFRAAARYNRSQYFAALFIGLAVFAAVILIVPMSWMYVRCKREPKNPVIVTVDERPGTPT